MLLGGPSQIGLYISIFVGSLGMFADGVLVCGSIAMAIAGCVASHRAPPSNKLYSDS